MPRPEYILYLEVDSYESRRIMTPKLDDENFNWLDCTGNQAAFYDNRSINDFIESCKRLAEENRIEINYICRMPDPGVGLIFNEDLVKEDIRNGTLVGWIKE